jgi:DmsE family decaheme c-type cytochrome
VKVAVRSWGVFLYRTKSLARLCAAAVIVLTGSWVASGRSISNSDAGSKASPQNEQSGTNAAPAAPTAAAPAAAAVPSAPQAASQVPVVTASPTPAVPPPTYMGEELCSRCHYDKFISLTNNRMGIHGDPKTPAGHEGCESCHGPASNHVGGGGGRGVGGLMNFAKTLPTASKNAVCLTCHTRGYVALWHGSKHDEAKLACVDCHQIHGGNPKLLAQPSQVQLCTRCHQQIRTSIMKPSHHPLREEKMVCTNCHNPHGTQTERLIAANSVNDKCYECHGEKRGPFLWEHPPVRESCLNCHDPHGTSHEPLLVMKKPMLCQRCHSNVLHPGQLLAIPAGSNTTVYQQPGMLQYRSCTNCHVMIHGSNHPSGKFFHR